MRPRTLRLDDTVIVLEHVRGFRVENRYVKEGELQAYTAVWLLDVAHPVFIFGDHLDTLQRALEGHDDSRLVLLESPYAGNVEGNLAYARAAMRDSLLRGEYPFASHIMYTPKGILDDRNPSERALGIAAGLAWGRHAARSVVYTDRGITDGMRAGLERAREEGREAVTRSLEGFAQ